MTIVPESDYQKYCSGDPYIHSAVAYMLRLPESCPDPAHEDEHYYLNYETFRGLLYHDFIFLNPSRKEAEYLGVTQKADLTEKGILWRNTFHRFFLNGNDEDMRGHVGKLQFRMPGALPVDVDRTNSIYAKVQFTSDNAEYFSSNPRNYLSLPKEDTLSIIRDLLSRSLVAQVHDANFSIERTATNIHPFTMRLLKFCTMTTPACRLQSLCQDGDYMQAVSVIDNCIAQLHGSEIDEDSSPIPQQREGRDVYIPDTLGGQQEESFVHQSAGVKKDNTEMATLQEIIDAAFAATNYRYNNSQARRRLDNNPDIAHLKARSSGNAPYLYPKNSSVEFLCVRAIEAASAQKHRPNRRKK